jgi:hypothetical protein
MVGWLGLVEAHQEIAFFELMFASFDAEKKNNQQS